MKFIKHIFPFIFCIILTSPLWAQEDVKLRIFLRDELEDGSAEIYESAEDQFREVLVVLKDKKEKYRSDRAFLEFTFSYIHKKFLKEYEQYVTVSQAFVKNGKYDCVTGTALYALALEELGYQYEIRETDYHVFLMVKVDDREYMFESTDAINGFAYDKREIEERRNFVLNDARAINEKMAMSGVSAENKNIKITVIDNSVSLKELSGLHFYNQALKKFNNQDYREAFRLVTIAQGIYPSNRIKNAASYMFAVAFED